MAARYPDLSGFATPDEVLSRLHDRVTSPQQKNLLLHAILRASKSGFPELSGHLLTLALWPGLDAVRHRLRPFFRGRFEELDGELLGQIGHAIAVADPSRVNAVAATLLRNVERDIKRASRAASEFQMQCVEIDDEALVTTPADEPDEMSRDLLAQHLRERLGEDGDLVASVSLDGLSRTDAGRQLGLSPETARKRYQRALARLKSGTIKH